MTSQIQVVLSRDLGARGDQEEKLDENPEFDPPAAAWCQALLGLFGIGRDPSALTREERTLEAYYERLNVYAIEKSRVIAVDFRLGQSGTCRARRQFAWPRPI